VGGNRGHMSRSLAAQASTSKNNAKKAYPSAFPRSSAGQLAPSPGVRTPRCRVQHREGSSCRRADGRRCGRTSRHRLCGRAGSPCPGGTAPRSCARRTACARTPAGTSGGCTGRQAAAAAACCLLVAQQSGYAPAAGWQAWEEPGRPDPAAGTPSPAGSRHMCLGSCARSPVGARRRGCTARACAAQGGASRVCWKQDSMRVGTSKMIARLILCVFGCC